MVSDKTLLYITITCFLIMIVSVGFVAIYENGQAKKTCSYLKSENDCSYEICMAAEYSSNNQRDKAESCILKQIYKDAILGADV